MSLFRLHVYHYTLVYGSDKGASQMLHTPLIVYLTLRVELGDAANIVLNSSFFVYFVHYLGGERIKSSLEARFVIKKQNRRNFIASLQFSYCILLYLKRYACTAISIRIHIHMHVRGVFHMYSTHIRLPLDSFVRLLQRTYIIYTYINNTRHTI